MSIFNRKVVFGLAMAMTLAGAEIVAQLAIPGGSGFIQSAEARVGRPLTPVSVAGVARRTVRRCAVGVYRC